VRSLLSLDIDNFKSRLLCKFEDVAGLAGQKANAAVIFALDQVLTTVIADELYAVARTSVRIFIFALEGKSLDNNIKTDFGLVPVAMLLACSVWDRARALTHDLHIVDKAARRSRATIMSRRYAPR